MKFLVGNQLPVSLKHFLVARGAACQHVLDAKLDASSDKEIWQYADDNDHVVISKDEDFLHLAHARASTGRLVWIRLGNCRTKTLLAVMAIAWPKIEAALDAGDRIIEVR